MLAFSTPAPNIEPPHYQDFSDYLTQLSYDSADSLENSPSASPFLRHQLMSAQSQPSQNPSIRVHQSSPFSAEDQGVQQQMLAQQQFSGNNWGSSDSLLSPAVFLQNTGAQKRLNDESYHKRTSSASSVVSAGPPSPQDSTTAYPRIAGSESSHFSPSAFDPFDIFATTRPAQMPKSLPTPVDTPTQNNFSATDFHAFSSPHESHNPAAMRRIPHTHSPKHDDDAPYHSYPQSVSSASHHDSPATPQTAYDGEFGDPAKGLQNQGFNPQLNNLPHGMPAVNVDDFYNSQLQNLPSQQQQQQMMARAGVLSPYRTSLANRFHAAQLDHVASRSSSPAHSIQREKSPFRQDSAYSQNTQVPQIAAQRLARPQMTPAQYQQQQVLNNAAMMGQQHQQQRQPDQPKTVSPKDVELEYHEEEQTPLFPSSQQSQFSLGREESNFSTTSAYGHPTQYYATVPSSNQQGQQYPFLGQQHRQQSSLRSNADHSLPDFPAHLASMETTVSSESGQETHTPIQPPKSTPITRPRDTSADVGAYSCTFHGCNQRFDTPAKLQRHKRDVHRQPSPSTGTSAPLPTHSTANQGHVASASIIANRNAQAGPHRCDRVNPTTGKPCNSVFSRPYDLTRHEDTIHNGRKIKVRCHLCTEEKTFSRNDALTRHMRVVHPEVDWPGKTKRKGRD